jgi:hypothetical protein
MTVDRTPEYVHGTLASLFASAGAGGDGGPAEVHLVVGSADCSYLDRYRHHGRVRIHPLPEAEWDRVGRLSVKRRFCHNYHRCLTLPLDGCRGLCVCEDDVVVRDGFAAKLRAAADEMERAHGLRRYLLAGYAPYDPAADPSLGRGRYYASYYAPGFYGTQCMYYPAAVVGRLADRVLRDGLDGDLAGDMVVKAVGLELNAIYGTVASLAQHVGRRTTGLGNFHQSPTFDRPFPDARAGPGR